MNTEQARFNMVEQQIRPSAPLREDVRELLLAVPREDFVPTAFRHLAFADVEIPLDDGATMLPPRIDALAIQALNPKKHDKVLEIGTGSGFMAALLAVHAEYVTTVEILPHLADQARANLQRAGVDNAAVIAGDGLAELPDVPRGVLTRLKVGGRLFAFVGSAPLQTAVLVTRVGDQDFRYRRLFETFVAPLRLAKASAKFEL
jgi:protein-L-isoaspartate(D-aspartate) O-methyltransferase